MFFQGKSKQLPYLSEYLNEAIKRPLPVRRDPLPIYVSVGALAGSLAAVLVSWGHSAPAIAGSFFLLGASVFMCARSAVRYSEAPVSDDSKIKLKYEAREQLRLLYDALHRRKLHREISGPSASLLEYAAYQWDRIQRALNGNYWLSEAVPGHWVTLRDHALQAADSAMDEMMVTLRSSYQRSGTKEDVIEFVGGLMEQFGVSLPQTDEPLPPGYHEARDIAEKLRTLAIEVEGLSQEIATSGVISTEQASGLDLERCLTEIRSLRTAEEELRQNLGQGG